MNKVTYRVGGMPYDNLAAAKRNAAALSAKSHGYMHVIEQADSDDGCSEQAVETFYDGMPLKQTGAGRADE